MAEDLNESWETLRERFQRQRLDRLCSCLPWLLYAVFAVAALICFSLPWVRESIAHSAWIVLSFHHEGHSQSGLEAAFGEQTREYVRSSRIGESDNTARTVPSNTDPLLMVYGWLLIGGLTRRLWFPHPSSGAIEIATSASACCALLLSLCVGMPLEQAARQQAARQQFRPVSVGHFTLIGGAAPAPSVTCERTIWSWSSLAATFAAFGMTVVGAQVGNRRSTLWRVSREVAERMEEP